MSVVLSAQKSKSDKPNQELSVATFQIPISLLKKILTSEVQAFRIWNFVRTLEAMATTSARD
jgi:hypothetical protein